MLSSLLMFSAACASTSDRAGTDPSSSGSSTSSPQGGPSTEKTSGPTRTQKSHDPKAKPKVDPAKASPGGLTVRYLKDGKVTQVDVPDFER